MSDRSELLANARSFLRDTNVRNSSIYRQISFLESKGLTKEEINALLNEVKDSIPSQQSQNLIPSATSSASDFSSHSSSSNNNFINHLDQIQEKLRSQNLPMLTPEIELKIKAGQLTAPSRWSWRAFFLYLALVGGLLAAFSRYISDSWIKRLKGMIKKVLSINNQELSNDSLRNEIIQLRYMLSELSNKVNYMESTMDSKNNDNTLDENDDLKE